MERVLAVLTSLPDVTVVCELRIAVNYLKLQI